MYYLDLKKMQLDSALGRKLKMGELNKVINELNSITFR